MKLLLLATCLLTSVVSYCQLSIKAGPNYSYFTQGDKIYSGIEHAEFGIKAGVTYDYTIKKTKKRYTIIDHWVIVYKDRINTPWSVNGCLFYIHLAAKNPTEGYNNQTDKNTNFSTYHLMLPLTLSFKTGYLSISGGAYVTKLLYAQNRETFGGGFGWQTGAWDYYHQCTVGLIGGISYDLQGAIIEFNAMRGLTRVQNWYDPKKDLGKDAAFSVMIGVPLSNFSNK